MTKVYCYRSDCINRSNRRSQSKNKRGEYLYRCTKGDLTIKGFTGFYNSKLEDAQPGVCKCLNYCSKDEF